MLIYLHIPFCDSLCHYCAFNSYVDKYDLKKSYMKSIVEHLKLELSRFEPDVKSIRSLFIGGGTPSTIDSKLYHNFFEELHPYLREDAEITTEANPNSATPDWLQGMKELGVNRISFGVQSFDDEKLKFLGRNHSKRSAINAVVNAGNRGFENISLDLIYGTALDSKSLLSKDLKTAFTLPINHLSAYSLTIEENTPFFKTPKAAVDSLELARYFTEEIKKRGFEQYEISNFGRYQSIHNLGYWQHDDYIGIGAGAIGFKRNKRFYTAKKIEDFIANPEYNEIEELTSDDLHMEKIFLGLRSRVGISTDELSISEMENTNILIDEKKLTLENGRVYNRDYFLSDELALFITD